MSLLKKVIQYKPQKTDKEKLAELSPRQIKIRQKKEAREKQIGRWVVAVVFAVSVGGGALALAAGRIAEWWARWTTPVVIGALPEAAEGELAPVREEIESVIKGKSGTYGVWVKYQNREETVGINQNEALPAASLIKLPVMVAFFREAEMGRISLDEEYRLLDEDKVGGAGVLAGKPAGTVYSYRQLLQLMGHYSDNTAYKVVRRRVGDEAVEATMAELGMNRTDLAENETTPAEVGLLFEKLMTGKILSKTHREELLGFLTDTVFEDRIPAGVPEGTRVAHKVGTDLGVYHDAGIVFASPPVGGFVMVVMSKNARESEAREVAVQVTKIVVGVE